MQSDILLISIGKDELQSLIREAVKSELSNVNKKKLLTSNELCKELGICLSTLNNWKADGQIPFKRMGKRIYYDYVEVVAAMNDSHYSKLKHLKSTGS